MPSWDINFGWTSNAQALDAHVREVRAVSDRFARMIVNDVALASTEAAYQKNRAALVSSVRRAALAEVSRMAMMISQRIAVPDKYSGPTGSMSIKEGMSDTAKRLGFRATFDRAGTDIGSWPKRQKHYLPWKRRHGHPSKWWELDGDLSDRLKSDELYLKAWGPVNVIFRRPANQQAARANMKPSFINTAGGPASGQSTSSNVQASITHGGRAGRISAEYQVGRLEVATFGRITRQMLPALGQKNMNPYYAKPAGNIDGLAGLLPDDGEGGVRNKLLGRQAQRRYALEPFASFFLTRAIPNAVWRRTETLIASSGIRQAGKLN